MATDVHVGSYGDVDRPANDPPEIEVPGKVQRNTDRSWKVVKRDANKRRLCIRFERGDTFTYLDDKGAMQALALATNPRGGGKPPHRIRNRYNYIRPIIEDKVSAATQRVPSYEIVPSTADPEDAEAASLAQKVAVYGYDQWNIRGASIDAVKTAIGLGGSAYALPYFEPNVGPYRTAPDGEVVGDGDVRVKIFGGNEVGWEPGTDFEQSRYWVTFQVLPLDQVYEMPGYAGGKLVPDASSSDIPNDADPEGDGVLVVDYYERPCPRYPEGRWFTMANRRVIVDNRLIDPRTEDIWQDYPLRDADGTPLDECLLHRLVYTHDPDDDDDLGLTWQLIDFQRSAQDCVAGETLVRTADGLRRADELAGQTVDTLTIDGTYRPAKWESYGPRELWRVTFANGETLYASENHEWIVNAPGAGNVRRVRTPELLGEKVPLISRWPGSGVEDREEWQAGVQNGLVYGDGWATKSRRGRSKTYSYFGQYTPDGCELVERFFPGRHGPRQKVEGRTQLITKTLAPELKQIPDPDRSRDYLLGFIAGALAADGCVNAQGAVLLSSANRDDLQRIAQIARAAGLVVTCIRKSRGGTAYKADAELWNLGLSKAGFVGPDGVDRDLILRDWHADKLWNSTLGRVVRMTTRRVVDVERTHIVAETYCCTEPVTQSWVTGGGLVTSNCVNKIMELKNRGLNLQMIAPAGSFIDRKDDVPGAVHYYRLSPNGEKPQWEPAPSGDMLNQLLQIKNMIVQDMQSIAAFQDIQADPNVAAKTGQLAIENARARWQSFLGDLAEWHSRLMRHCLMLTARYYTEPRLLDLRGRLGWESIKNFRGAQLMGQTNVRVFPGSLEYLSRERVMSIVQYYASMQWITKQEAMMAIERGQIDYLTQSFDLDVARISRIIERVKDGSIMDMPTKIVQVPAIDPATGGPAMGPDGRPLTIPQDVPAWMPDKWDDVPVWQENMAIWLKSDDFERSSREAQEVGRLIWEGLEQLEQEHAQDQAQQQMAMAQSLGMGNAAAPQGPPSLPSQPNIAADQPAPAKAPQDQAS